MIKTLRPTFPLNVQFTLAWFIFTMLCMNPVHAGLEWAPANSPPTQETWLSVRLTGNGNGALISGGNSMAQFEHPLSFYHTKNDGETWTKVLHKFGTGSTRSLIFANEKLGFALGEQRGMYRTVDGGETWNWIPLNDGQDPAAFYKIAFSDSMNGIAVGSKFQGSTAGVLYRTRNAGMSWEFDSSFSGGLAGFGANTRLLSVAFADAEIGIATGMNGLIFRTTDGGETWNAVEHGLATGNLSSVVFAGARVGVAVGDSAIIRSIDGGSTWSLISRHAPITSNVISFADEKHGFLGMGGKNWLTSDAGETWIETTVTAKYSSISFSDAKTGIMAGYGFIARTTDAGESWVPISASFNAPAVPITHIVSVDTNVLLALGTGVIQRSKDGGVTWQRIEGINEDLKFASFTDAKTGFSYSNRAFYRSSDAGGSWVRDSLQTGRYIQAARLISPKIGIGFGAACEASGCSLNFLHSNDGGLSWSWKKAPDSLYHFPDGLIIAYINSLSCPTQSVCVAGGNRGLLRTEDGGETWSRVSSNEPEYTLHSIAFADSLSGIAVGLIEDKFSKVNGGQVLIRTGDGGKNWSMVPSGLNQYYSVYYSVAFADSKHGLVVGTDGGILETLDGGINWQDSKQVLTGSSLTAVAYSHSGRWIVGGGGGEILISGKSPTSAPNRLTPKSPAPSEPQGRLSLIVSSSGIHATLGDGHPWKAARAKLYDLVGKVKVKSKNSNSGSELLLPTDRLKRGIYLFEINDGNLGFRQRILVP